MQAPQSEYFTQCISLHSRGHWVTPLKKDSKAGFKAEWQLKKLALEELVKHPDNPCGRVRRPGELLIDFDDMTTDFAIGLLTLVQQHPTLTQRTKSGKLHATYMVSDSLIKDLPKEIDGVELFHNTSGRIQVIYEPLRFLEVPAVLLPPAVVKYIREAAAKGFKVSTTQPELFDNTTAERNNTLNKAGYIMRSSGLDMATVEAVLREKNEQLDKGKLEEKELRALFGSLAKVQPGDPEPIPETKTAVEGVIPSQQWQHLDIKPLEYLAPGVALGSSMLITGDSGVGKSIYVLDLARRTALAAPDKRFLLIDAENPPHVIKGRLGPGIENLDILRVQADKSVFAMDLSPWAGTFVDTITGVLGLGDFNDPRYFSPVSQMVQQEMEAGRFMAWVHHHGKDHSLGGAGSEMQKQYFETVVAIYKSYKIVDGVDEVTVRIREVKNRNTTRLDQGIITLRQEPGTMIRVDFG